MESSDDDSDSGPESPCVLSKHAPPVGTASLPLDHQRILMAASELASGAAAPGVRPEDPARVTTVAFAQPKLGLTISADSSGHGIFIAGIAPGVLTAEQRGLVQEGDRLIAIDDCSIAGRSLAEVHARVAAAPRPVKLSFLPRPMGLSIPNPAPPPSTASGGCLRPAGPGSPAPPQPTPVRGREACAAPVAGAAGAGAGAGAGAAFAAPAHSLSPLVSYMDGGQGALVQQSRDCLLDILSDMATQEEASIGAENAEGTAARLFQVRHGPGPRGSRCEPYSAPFASAPRADEPAGALNNCQRPPVTPASTPGGSAPRGLCTEASTTAPAAAAPGGGSGARAVSGSGGDWPGPRPAPLARASSSTSHAHGQTATAAATARERVGLPPPQSRASGGPSAPDGGIKRQRAGAEVVGATRGPPVTATAASGPPGATVPPRPQPRGAAAGDSSSSQLKSGSHTDTGSTQLKSGSHTGTGNKKRASGGGGGGRGGQSPATTTSQDVADMFAKLGSRPASELTLYQALTADDLLRLLRYAGDKTKRQPKTTMAQRVFALYHAGTLRSDGGAPPRQGPGEEPRMITSPPAGPAAGGGGGAPLRAGAFAPAQATATPRSLLVATGSAMPPGGPHAPALWTPVSHERSHPQAWHGMDRHVPGPPEEMAADAGGAAAAAAAAPPPYQRPPRRPGAEEEAGVHWEYESDVGSDSVPEAASDDNWSNCSSPSRSAAAGADSAGAATGRVNGWGLAPSGCDWARRTPHQGCGSMLADIRAGRVPVYYALRPGRSVGTQTG